MNRLDRIDIPGEHEARERAWRLVQAAYAEREPLPRRRRRTRPALALALAASVAAVAFTPPGRAVLDTVREAIGIESADEALFSLPAAGRLLVVSDAGTWTVGEDGSARLLGGYRDATCSPFGRFLAASGPHQLAALEPDGDVHWKLLRRDVRVPRWGGTLTDTRIAYVSRDTVRVVAGDGTGDRSLGAGTAAAWRPGSRHVLAIAGTGELRAVEADNGRVLWRLDTPGARAVAWSADAKYLLALTPRGFELDVGSGSHLTGVDPRVIAAAFAPRGHRLALVRRTKSGSTLSVDGHVRFQGTGTFADVVWSPDGDWLAVSWPAADQLVFVRASGERRIEAAANLADQFESSAFPRIAAWCPLPPSR